MFKPDFIQKLKQSNISTTPEKTTERVRSIWRPLSRNTRNDILTLADVKKPSIERAYKTGNISAKIVVSMSQVLELDPRYILGTSDEQRPFNSDLLIEFLKEHNYDVSKRNLTTTRKRKDTTVANDAPLTSDDTDYMECPAQPNLLPVLEQLTAYFGDDVRAKLADLADDDMFAMLASLMVQADINEAKQDRLNLIKYLLVL
ncbi:MAG: hypothetical protein FWC71_02265 [Defluviitaleaceae bacterium]|nr:hypothetical protein [Defluviitaleaceae bacterium]